MILITMDKAALTSSLAGERVGSLCRYMGRQMNGTWGGEDKALRKEIREYFDLTARGYEAGLFPFHETFSRLAKDDPDVHNNLLGYIEVSIKKFGLRIR